MTTRRSFLALLGAAPVGVPAVAASSDAIPTGADWTRCRYGLVSQFGRGEFPVLTPAEAQTIAAQRLNLFARSGPPPVGDDIAGLAQGGSQVGGEGGLVHEASVAAVPEVNNGILSQDLP